MGIVQELLDRQYDEGTVVINCIAHMSMKITERPDDCRLCLADLRNYMSNAISLNKWLNDWKEDAMKILEER